MDYFRLFTNWTVGLFFPARCVGCGAFDTHLCDRCRSTIPRRYEQECIICKKPRPDGIPCRSCASHTCVDRLLIAGHLDHPLLRSAVRAFKYEYLEGLAQPLGDYLVHSLSLTRNPWELLSESPLVIPVPLHRRRLAERGFNQSELLARRLSRLVALACLPDAVHRTRRTSSQVRTESRWERIENMRGAFQVTKPELVAGRDILLVDDVCTTGATSDACARALKDAGARVVTAVVLARG